MPRFPLKQQLLFLVIAISAVVFVVAMFIIFPTIRRIQMLDKNLYATQEALQKQYEKTRHLRYSVTRLKETFTHVDAFDQAFVPQGKELDLIANLEQLAAAYRVSQDLRVNRARVTLKDADTDAMRTIAKSGITDYYEFSFVNTGSFGDLADYLRALEQTPFYAVIDSLTMTKNAEKNNAAPAVTLKFNARMFIKPSL